jgi:DNA polymerase epsilon subunit 1
VSVSNKRKRDSDAGTGAGTGGEDLSKSWRQVLGNPPPRSQFSEWLKFQKQKWAWQAKQKKQSRYAKTYTFFKTNHDIMER